MKTIILISENNNYKESVNYSFENVIELKEEITIDEREQLINKLSNIDIDQIILVDYLYAYRYIMQNVDKKFKWIITYSVASFTSSAVRDVFNCLNEYYDRSLVSSISCVDNDFNKLLKKAGYNTSLISFDIDYRIENKSKRKSIGIIGNDYNPNHNYYNQLTAIKLSKYSIVNICGKTNATKQFVDKFNIEHFIYDNYKDVIKNSDIILYCNFTDTINQFILMCLDNKIPCILGNTAIFDDYPIIKENLVLKSDDDVNEIAEKINNIGNNFDKVMEEYKIFRTKYTSDFKKMKNNFLNLGRD